MAKKPYTAKSITGAERMVRSLQKQVVTLDAIATKWNHERKMLAKLAATGPAFFNPLDVMDAERIRDEILAQIGMRPDGTFIPSGGR